MISFIIFVILTLFPLFALVYLSIKFIFIILTPILTLSTYIFFCHFNQIWQNHNSLYDYDLSEGHLLKYFVWLILEIPTLKSIITGKLKFHIIICLIHPNWLYIYSSWKEKSFICVCVFLFFFLLFIDYFSEIENNWHWFQNIQYHSCGSNIAQRHILKTCNGNVEAIFNRLVHTYSSTWKQ